MASFRKEDPARSFKAARRFCGDGAGADLPKRVMPARRRGSGCSTVRSSASCPEDVRLRAAFAAADHTSSSLAFRAGRCGCCRRMSYAMIVVSCGTSEIATAQPPQGPPRACRPRPPGRARGTRRSPADEAEQSSARARGADDGDVLPRSHLEGEVVEDRDGSGRTIAKRRSRTRPCRGRDGQRSVGFAGLSLRLASPGRGGRGARRRRRSAPPLPHTWRARRGRRREHRVEHELARGRRG